MTGWFVTIFSYTSMSIDINRMSIDKYFVVVVVVILYLVVGLIATKSKISRQTDFIYHH